MNATSFTHARMSRRTVLSLLVCLLCVRVASGQVATGFPPFASFSGGPDSVNNANGNVHLTIPVFSRPGRGTSLSFALQYDSSVWTPYGAYGGYYGVWGPAGGWKTPFSLIGSYDFSQVQVCCPGQHCNPDLGTGIYYNKYSGWVYTDGSGTHHSLAGGIVNDSSIACPSGTGSWSGTAAASDGSGWTLAVDASPEATFAYDTQGNSFGLQNSIITDRNGNQISVGSTAIDDTLSSTTPALTVSGSGSPIIYTYTNTLGQPATVKYNYQTFTVRTNFGCSGVTEYGPTSQGLVTEIDLPDSSKYTFTYEPTPGYPGDVTGRLASVTLPTGGQITYSYSGPNNGITCADGSISTLTRTTPDGTWTYAHSESTSWTTLITDPSNNQTNMTFQGIYETQRQIYHGSVSPGNLQLTVFTCYNGATPPCNATLSSSITQKSVYTQWPSGLESETNVLYNNVGLPTEKDDYDYGSGSPGSLLKKTLITYASLGNYLSGFPQTVTIQDGSSNIKFRQDTAYDQYSGGLICVTGAPNHDDSGHGCTFTSRANATSTTNYTDPVTPSGGITKNFTYDSLGNLRTAQLNCCQLKTWNYSSTTSYAFPDSIVSGNSSPHLTTSYTYDMHMGLVLTSTDPNNIITTLTYDSMGRPLTTATGNLPATNYTYTDSGNWSIKECAPVQGTQTACQNSIFDGLGRTKTIQLLDGSSNLYSAIDTRYDSLGRAYKTSNPYTSSPSYWTQLAFDVLSRTTSTTLPDNSVSSISYADNTVTSTDPAGKQRKAVSDGLGRLTTVYEPDPTNNNSLTLLTSYVYNVLNQLTQVTQGAQSRTFVYDALGRLTSSTTPEAGTVCFGTVSSGVCQPTTGYDSWNNLLYRTDARGVVTNYLYDTLNRLVGITYPTVPSGVTPMPNDCKANGSGTNNAFVCFTYGTTAASYNNGRIISMYDSVGSESYTYDKYGNVTQLAKIIGTTTYTTNYQYNYANQLSQITYPSGRAVAQNVDTLGRFSSIVGTLNSVQTTYASGFAYNAAQQTSALKYGNNLYASFGFYPDTLLLQCLDYSTTNRSSCAHDSSTKFGLSYSFPASPANNGQISGITDGVDSGRSASYTYDSLYRLTNASTTGSTAYPKWGLSETYDRYGNRTAQAISSGCTGITCPTNSVTVSTTTNRLTGSPYTYDASGNITNDGLNSLVYDGENRATSATNGSSSGIYTYDGNGLRIKKIAGSTTTVYIFSGSKVVAEYDNGAAVGSPSREYIYAGGALLAKIDPSGTKYYHQDHLSNRLVTDSSGNVLAQVGHFPYGESWYNGSNDKLLFTTYERDSESGNDYAMARYNISRLGRFSSPDPIAGSAVDPQSLNRYSYVRNMPTISADPSGLFSCVTAEENSPHNNESSGGSKGHGPSPNESDASPEPQSSGCQLVAGGPGAYLDGSDITSDYGVGPDSMGFAIGGGPSGQLLFPIYVSGPPDDLTFDYGDGLLGIDFPSEVPGGEGSVGAGGDSFFNRLAECARTQFKVTVTSFTPAVSGEQNGSLAGTLPSGKQFNITTDATSYSTFGLNLRYNLLGYLTGKPTYGYTNILSPSKNYVVNDIKPTDVATPLQVHEDGHSLAALTGDLSSSDKTADKFMDCVYKMTRKQ